ncbi:MAG: flippase [Oscillospiraceae bacterium]|nr:flippase [Oscillospiraceae bacterium]
MSQQKSLKLNFVMNAILTMSSFIFPLITFPYVSRILLPTGTGKVSFATSLISYFSMFAQLGIPTYGVRACAKVRDDREKLTRTAQELLIINLVMDVVSYVALAIALIYVPRLREDRALYVVVSFTIILTSIGMEWLYKALEQYTYITIRSIIFKFVALVAMFLLIHQQEDYVIYGAISIFAASASNIFNFINAHKYVDMKPVGNYNFKRHFKPVAVFFAMSCATTVYTNLDTVMLGFMKGDEDVGYYNAAVKIKSVLVSVVTSLGTVLLPRSSYYVERGQLDEFRRITSKALNFVFLVAAPLMLYFILYAKQGVYLLSGTAYTGSIVSMQIIMPTLLFIGLTNILGIQMLVPLGRERVVLYSEIAGAVVDLALNALLIPRFASSGAAIGTLAAEFVVLVVQFAALRKDVAGTFRKISYWKIALGLLLGTAASYWVAGLGLGNFLTLAISACLFFGVYGLLLLITKERMTIEIFNQLLAKLKKKKD